MPRAVALLVLCCLSAAGASAAAASRRHLAQTPASPVAASPTATYVTLADAIAAAAAGAPNLSTLLAAVQAAGVADSLTADTAWTILAPTNDAFARLASDLSITPDELLQPANKETLVKVLSAHVIPSGAVLSSQLTDGQVVATALAGTSLTIKIGTDSDGKPTVTFVGPTNSARVVVADIAAGKSVIHVIDAVLRPAGIGKAADMMMMTPATSGK